MKEVYLLNAFSLQMLEGDAIVRFTEVSSDEIFTVADWGPFEYIFLKPGIKSAVGHQDTAIVLGVPINRINVSLTRGDVAFVAQLQGGRMPEGSTTLPEGFTFKFIKVEVL